MLKFFDIEQNTDEWLDLRAGKPTGSKAGVIMANLGKAFSDTAKKYAVNIAIEQLTGNRIPSEYSNAHMTRGHEQEPLARAAYEGLNFVDVAEGGFFLNDGVGISPDGLVGDNGLIEIKSVIPTAVCLQDTSHNMSQNQATLFHNTLLEISFATCMRDLPCRASRLQIAL